MAQRLNNLSALAGNYQRRPSRRCRRRGADPIPAGHCRREAVSSASTTALTSGMAADESLLLYTTIFLFAAVVDAVVPPVPPVRAEVNDAELTKFGMNDEQRLLRFILREYDSSVRPVFNASTVVEVHMGLTLTHIFNIDEKNQVLALNVWVEQSWFDERIQWDPLVFGNISKLTVPTTYVWTPDIVLYNNARDFSRGFVQTNLHIDFTGAMQWAPPAKVYSICKLDVTFFPFDDQFCALEFGSWIYDRKQLDVIIVDRGEPFKTPFTIDSFTENGEWEIVANRTRRFVKRSIAQNSNLVYYYPVITFELHMRRRMLYFLYNIIIPCIMLSVLTMMQFYLPCESGEKVTLGLTVLLAYSVFSFNIAENMPETSEVIPLVAIYLMAIMGISATSVCLSVVVLNMRHGGERKRPVPVWLQYVAYRIIGKIICWRGDETRKLHRHHSELSFNAAFHSLSQQLTHSGTQHQQSSAPQSVQFRARPPTDEAQIESEPHTAIRRDPSPMVELCGLARSDSLDNGDLNADSENLAPRRITFSSDADPETIRPQQRALRDNIMRRAGKLMDRIETEHKTDELVHQWRRVSKIFDQFFFGLIICLTTGTTVTLLVLAPRFSHRSFSVDT